MFVGESRSCHRVRAAEEEPSRLRQTVAIETTGWLLGNFWGARCTSSNGCSPIQEREGGTEGSRESWERSKREGEERERKETGREKGRKGRGISCCCKSPTERRPQRSPQTAQTEWEYDTTRCWSCQSFQDDPGWESKNTLHVLCIQYV